MDLDSEIVHQFHIACADGLTVDDGAHPLAGNLLYIRDFAIIIPSVVGSAQSFCDRMGGETLDVRGQMQEFLLPYHIRMHRGHLEHPLSESAGFVENDSLQAGKLLQPVGTFDEDSLSGSGAYSSEETERHGNHQRAGAADDQESQRPVEPGGERASEE